jgi:hypothetical protein
MRFFMVKKRTDKKPSPSSPTVHGRHGGAAVAGRTTTLLAGIRADRTTFIAFPGTRRVAQWLRDES